MIPLTQRGTFSPRVLSPSMYVIYFPFSLYLVLTYTHRYKHTLQICNRIVDPCLFLHSKNSPGYWSTYVLAWCLGQQMGTILPGEGNIRGLLWENVKWNKELRIAEAHKIAQTHNTCWQELAAILLFQLTKNYLHFYHLLWWKYIRGKWSKRLTNGNKSKTVMINTKMPVILACLAKTKESK